MTRGQKIKAWWVLVFLVSFIFTIECTAQTKYGFQKDKGYPYVQVEIDSGGSLDKEGLNSVITLGFTGEMGYNGPRFDISGSVQTVYTNKHNETSEIVRYYLDWGVQVQSIITLAQRWEMSIGARAGMIHLSNDSTSGVGFYGGIIQGNFWVSDHLAFVVSTTLDKASDLSEDERAQLTVPGFRYSFRYGVRYMFGN